MIRSSLAAAVALSMVGAAHAEPGFNAQTLTQKVRFADLDISTDVGARRLAFRIQTAAEDLCSSRPMSRQDYGYWPCVRQTAGRAADQLGSAKVALALGVPPTVLARR